MSGTDYLSVGKISFTGINGNFILSGKLRMETSEVGVCVGSWVLPPNTIALEVIGHVEGTYKGLEFHSFLNVETNEFHGFMIDHGDDPGN